MSSSIEFASATQTYLTQSNQWQQNLTKIYYSSIIIGYIDNDGDLDLITTGSCGANCFNSDVYINNGTSLSKSQAWGSNLTDVDYGSLAFGDIDNDGDLDLVLTGCNNGGTYVGGCGSGGIQTFIYINNGSTLIESSQWQNNLTKTFRGGLAFGDINNDGDLDLVLTGETSSSVISKIYINNGSTLIESSQWQNNLTAVRQSGLAFGDIDNDGDLDLIISGRDLSSNKRTIVYINNDTSLVESQQWQQNLETMDDSSVILGDIDNDGDLDLGITGCCDKHRIYRNNGTTFIEIQRELTDLGAVFAGSQAVGDYDNEGYLDLITNGREEYTFLYLYNSSSTNFTTYSQDPESHILDVIYGSLVWADLDNDSDLDLIETGYGSEGGGSGNATAKAFVYLSNRSLTKNNNLPLPPNSSFSLNYVNNVLTLSWGNGSDVETNILGLYYNLIVGNVTNNHSIVSGVYGGGEDNGYFGNMMQRKSIALNVQLEANKTYYWQVQTIDTGLAKSNWSAMQNFTTSLDVTKPNVILNYPSPNSSLHTTNPYFIFNTTVTDANLTNVTLNANWTGSWHVNQSNSSGINGTYTFSVNLTNNVDGHYAWYIGANDSSNNSETSGIRDFYLDRAYPIVRLISPANSASWTSSSTVTFTYNVSDVDVSNCSLFIDGNVVNASNSITESAQQNFTYFLSNGNYNWQVNCTDYVGFTNSSETRSLSVSYTAPSSGSSGGRGGGIAVTTKTYTLTNEQLLQGYTQILSKNDKIKFLIANENHSLMLDNLNTNLSYANLTLNSTPLNFLIYINEEKKFELTNDNYYDLSVKLNFINNDKANLTIKAINEKVNETRIEEEKEAVKESKEVEKEKGELAEEKLEKLWLWIIGLVAVIILLIMSLRRYIKYRQWKRYALIG